MVKNVGAFAQALATQLIALGMVWMLLVAVSWMLLRFCFNKEVSWASTARWISGSMVFMAVAMGSLYILPESLTDPINKVLVPCSICAIAIHSLLLVFDRYVRHKYGQGFVQTRLILLIVLVYVLAIVTAIGLIKIHNSFLIDVFYMTVDYLTKGAIVALLLLEVLSGRCKDQPQNSDRDSLNSVSNYW